jgi:isopentenyl-diphosphate delta-isomerase
MYFAVPCVNNNASPALTGTIMPDLILVNEQDEQTGLMEKMEVHRKGLLHRAFSVYIYDNQRELLLQKRAAGKYHCAGMWTNTCCGHPLPGEAVQQGAVRRLKEEMGFSCSLTKVFELQYRLTLSNGLIEHEYLHVFAGKFNGHAIQPNPDEVEDYLFLPSHEIHYRLGRQPELFTPWFHLVFPETTRRLFHTGNQGLQLA